MLQIAPVAPALTDSVRAAFQVHIDSMTSHVGYALDRAYLEQQVSTHALMTDYLTQLATVAQAPELRAWLESVKKQLAGQVTLVQAQQTALAVADSVRADSIARRAEARKRRMTGPDRIPDEVWDDISRAGQLADDLSARGQSVRFDTHRLTNRVVASLVDDEGRVLRPVELGELFGTEPDPAPAA